MTDLPTIVIDIPGKALAKANMHKVARRGGSRRRTVVNDLTGCLAQSEQSFFERAFEQLDDDVAETLPWGKGETIAIEARVEFVYAPTASWDQWKIDAAKRGSFRRTMTPDLENVAKYVFDCLAANKKAKRIGFYTDDKLIFRQALEKRYGEEDRVIVTLIKHPQATRKTWKDLPCD